MLAGKKHSGLTHTHKADNDCDKKTLAHYNSYLWQLTNELQ